MYSVGLDVDKLVFTEKILLYAENSCISGPLVSFTFGIIYLLQQERDIGNNLIYSFFFFLRKWERSPRQSAGNLSFSRKAMATTKNTYNSYTNLPLISEHVFAHKSNLTDI